MTSLLSVARACGTASLCAVALTASEAVTFDAGQLVSYSGQDRDRTLSVEDSGATLRITGNGWVAMPVPYEVTAETVLEFDFSSSVEGEIHAIGAVASLRGFDARRNVQLHGTQTWGLQQHNDYPGSGQQAYEIPIGALLGPGAITHLTFIMDHDRAPQDGESVFSRVQLFEPGGDDGSRPSAAITASVTTGTVPLTVSFQGSASGFATDGGRTGTAVAFAAESLVDYGGVQAGHGAATIEDGGSTLRLTGNRWLAVPLPAELAPEAELELGFAAPIEAEIQGIGVDRQTSRINAGQTFQLAGSQTWGLQDARAEASATPRTVRLPVGRYAAGGITHLVFVNDHDSGAKDGVAVFSDVVLHNGGGGVSPLTFAWNFADGSTAEGAAVSHTFTSAGTYPVRLTVRGGGLTATANETIVVEAGDNPNRAPVIELASRLVTTESVFTIPATISDPDGDQLTINWRQNPGASVAEALLTDLRSEDPTATLPLAGDYSFTVTVSDGDRQVTDTVIISQAGAGRSFAGRVLDDEAPAGGLTVSLLWNGRVLQTAATDATNGRFAFSGYVGDPADIRIKVPAGR